MQSHKLPEGHSIDASSITYKKQYLIDIIHPIGSVYITTDSTNPSTIFGGTWEQIKDKFLLACGDTYSNGNTGGNSSVTLGTENLPERTMISTNVTNKLISYSVWTGGTVSGFIASDLYDLGYTYEQPFSIMPPYLVVYIWKRIS